MTNTRDKKYLQTETTVPRHVDSGPGDAPAFTPTDPAPALFDPPPELHARTVAPELPPLADPAPNESNPAHHARAALEEINAASKSLLSAQHTDFSSEFHAATQSLDTAREWIRKGLEAREAVATTPAAEPPAAGTSLGV